MDRHPRRERFHRNVKAQRREAHRRRQLQTAIHLLTPPSAIVASTAFVLTETRPHIVTKEEVSNCLGRGCGGG